MSELDKALSNAGVHAPWNFARQRSDSTDQSVWEDGFRYGWTAHAASITTGPDRLSKLERVVHAAKELADWDGDDRAPEHLLVALEDAVDQLNEEGSPDSGDPASAPAPPTG